MPRHEGSRHHDAGQARSSRRHSSSRRSSTFLSSADEESPRERDRYYPPRSSSNATPSLRRSSSRSGHANTNSNSSSGSGRTSRASTMMLNLLGIRRHERSGSDSSSTRRVPVVDDVYLKPTVPAYIRNNTGCENMPAPPYDGGTGAATTGPAPTTGTPYALSNIPAQIYYLQPQQSMPTMPTMPTMPAAGGSKENKPTFMGQPPATSTPPLSSQPQFVPSYYTYPPPNMYQWPHAGAPNPMVSVAVPVHGYPPPSSTVASQSHQSQTSDRTSVHEDVGIGRRRSHRPSSSRSSSCSTDRGGRRRSSPSRGHRRRHTRDMSCGSSVTETRYRPRRSRTSSRAHSRRSSPLGSRHRRHSPSVPKRAERHYCNGCGRQRSRKFHDANPFKRHKTLVSYCLKCRNAYDMCSEDSEVYEEQTERNIRAKSPIRSKGPETHEMRKTSRRVPVPHTIDSITPAMEEAIRALPKAYALPKVASKDVTLKEPLRGPSHIKEEKLEASPVKKSESKESASSSLRQPRKSVSISSMKKTRGYQPPTVESVLDSDDEEPSTHFQPRSTTRVWDSSSDDELPCVTKLSLGKSNSPAHPRAEVPEAHDERPSSGVSPVQHHVHFETQPRSGHHTQEKATAPSPFFNKANFGATFPPPMSPIITSPCLKKSVRRCASDHVNFEQYRKRHGMAKENQAPVPMPSFMTGASRCCDHVHSGVNYDKIYSQTMPNIPSTPPKRQTRDAYSSPLKPVTHDMCGYQPYTPTMPMPDSAYAPRTFSVHTVSPSLASEQLYQPETGQNVPPSPESPVSFKCPSVSASPGSVGQQECCPGCDVGQHTVNDFHPGHTERAMSDVTEEISSPQSHHDENTPPMNHDADMDPVTALGEGMPPYNFDLFSEGQHFFSEGWPQPSPGGESHDEPEMETADIYEDEDAKDGFENGYGDSFYSNTVVEDHAESPKDYRHHSFEDDPIIPDYNFDLFSDVTNRWPSPGADYEKTSETSYSKDSWSKASSRHGTEKENVSTYSRHVALAIRNKPRARKPSTLVVEEYNGTDDDATSVASSNFGKRGTRSLVSRTQRFVDCEVISNPDEPDVARTQPPLRCRASIRTIQTVY